MTVLDENLLATESKPADVKMYQVIEYMSVECGASVTQKAEVNKQNAGTGHYRRNATFRLPGEESCCRFITKARDSLT